MLSIKNLAVNFENLTAVNNLSFTFEPGKINGLIGPNGAGKSSLLKACVGLIDDYNGEIFYNEKILSENHTWVKQHCGYAPEDAELFPYLSGKEFLQLIAAIKEVKKINDEVSFFLDLTTLTDKKDELTVNYSHGMRQKLALASALIGNPDFIIIDESLNGLDPIALYRVKNYLTTLSQQGKTIILSSHILPLIEEWCDPILIMNRGNLVKRLSKDDLQQMQQINSSSFTEIFMDLIDE
jgi:ABC-2 type transport system ATP-binding protein